MWKLFFDGAYSKEGNGAGVLPKSPDGNLIPLSYKLEFDATNNIVEYEVMVLGEQVSRDLQIACLIVFGDFELIMKQIKNQCQTKHPRLKS